VVEQPAGRVPPQELNLAASTPARDAGLHPGPPLIELRGIRKAFGVVQAVRGVDLSFHAAEVHALVGENGAGKSTIIQIMSGVFRPDSGQILVRGTPMRFGSPAHAEAAGVSVVYQELSLVPDLDVAQNIYLHREPRRGPLLDTSRLYAQCRASLRDNEIHLDPHARVASLSVAQRQLVEIAKALSRDAGLVVMDEPTASLTSVEQDHLFAVIRRLRDRGTAVLYVSHRLEEIFEVADVVSVLKDGTLVRTMDVSATDRHELVSLMVGRSLEDDLFPPRQISTQSPREPLLTVRRLSSPGKIDEISFDLRPGEIVGLAGLIGSGRTSLFRAMFGVDPAASGSLTLGGAPIGRSPRAAMAAGIGFVTEDRKLEGLAVNLSNLTNLTATTLPGRYGIYDGTKARAIATDAVQRVRLDASVIDAPTRSLSGGNQQKVVVGKWLAINPRVLLCDEPTRGIDIGAKVEIYRLLRQLASRGMGIVFASSELPEILGLADRVLVMREGRLVAEFAAGEVTEEEIMRAAATEEAVS
jgi:ABC-type sugar transport system ATPase subunit